MTIDRTDQNYIHMTDLLNLPGFLRNFYLCYEDRFKSFEEANDFCYLFWQSTGFKHDLPMDLFFENVIRLKNNLEFREVSHEWFKS